MAAVEDVNARHPKVVRTRAYVVRCYEYESPPYLTRAEAEAHLDSIIDFDACRLKHAVEVKYAMVPVVSG